ncbi:hypothetical protein QR680_018128 [Steinernema hermaphroditum]|uniref:Uncharacterized protein n=1 Tax=Steinernema hermaphroditum TaxID=289476 RepID=A0AA39HJ21_9BILA|nr:hypothetical protein QR680_018128 [Steinernema hermaphroditum]
MAAPGGDSSPKSRKRLQKRLFAYARTALISQLSAMSCVTKTFEVNTVLGHPKGGTCRWGAALFYSNPRKVRGMSRPVPSAVGPSSAIWDDVRPITVWRMFEEEEPGKPKNWGCAIGTIAVVSLVNLGIFVTLRVLLDSENEFDEPILQGELREKVTVFLGIFSLSFCFGCCCCFCCGGSILKWIFACNCKCLDISTLWESAIKRPTLLKSKLRSDDSEYCQLSPFIVPSFLSDTIEDMIMKKQEEHLQRKMTEALEALETKPSDREPYEHTPPLRFFEAAETSQQTFQPTYTNDAFDDLSVQESAFASVHRPLEGRPLRETRIDFATPQVAPSKGVRIRSQSFSEFTDIPV